MKFLKNIEILFKKIIRRFVFSENEKFNPTVANSKIPEFENIVTILVLRTDRIGDLLVSIPTFKELRKICPNKKIDVLLSQRNFVAKAGIEKFVDNISVFPKNLIQKLKLLFKIRKKKYDLIIDLFDNASVTNSLLIKILNPKFSLGFEKENKKIYTHIVPLPEKTKIHIVERIAKILVPLGADINFKPERLEYPVTSEKLLPPKKSRRVGINICGSEIKKLWNKENWCKLINSIKEKYKFEIVIFGIPRYKNEIEFISKKTNSQIAPFVKQFDKFATMISECDYLITPDTSVVHLGSCFQIPTLAFYHFVSDKFGLPWFPYKTKYTYILSPNDFFEDITPELAFEEFKKLVEK